MKTKLICAALASAMLLCNACGKQNDAPDNESAADKGASESSNAAGSSTTDANTGAGTSDNDSAADTGAAENNTDGSVQATDNTEPDISVSVTFQTEENNETAEDGTPIYTSVTVYPVVSIEGNESAADKINTDIQTRVDAFWSDTATLDMAKEYYQYSLTEESGYDFLGYSSDLDFTVTRADSNVISFAVTYYSFSGGAHGNYTTIGVNYNPKSGELIDFSDLSENTDTFHANTLSFIKELAGSESYQEKLFAPPSEEELESTLYADEKWYFSTSGLVFISDPYLLGPYASGLITFTIPYSDLTDMGLKEEYQYTGRFTMDIADGDSYMMDINGDGIEDTIKLTTTYEENADGSSDFVPHLIINDVDISQGYNEELTNILTPWPTVALYDMNPDDDTIEIAVSVTKTNETTGEADFIISYFFRYEKDASVTYVDMTKGSATDPLMDFSNMR